MSSPPPGSLNRPRVHSVQTLDVTKLYGTTPALRGVSLQIETASTTLLSGPNGSGKSTLLSILGTRQRPSRGRVLYRDSTGKLLQRHEVRSTLGWVSHEALAYNELSGRENIQLMAQLQGVSEESVQAVMERVGLGSFAQRPLSTLSRGQKQRICLARALVHQPSFLLLDEPWTGLDQYASKELERIIAEEREKGTLVLIVSHEAGLAERLAAREIRLERGKLLSPITHHS